MGLKGEVRSLWISKKNIKCPGQFFFMNKTNLQYFSVYQPHSSVDPFFGLGGGGGAKVRKMQQKKSPQSRNIKLCAQSAPQKWKFCMFSGIFMFLIDLMVL